MSKKCPTCLGSGVVVKTGLLKGTKVCKTCYGAGVIYETGISSFITPVTEGDTVIFPTVDGIQLSEDELKLLRLLRKGRFDLCKNFITKLELAIEDE